MPEHHGGIVIPTADQTEPQRLTLPPKFRKVALPGAIFWDANGFANIAVSGMQGLAALLPLPMRRVSRAEGVSC